MSKLEPKFNFSDIEASAGIGQIHTETREVKNILRPQIFNEYERIMVDSTDLIGDYTSIEAPGVAASICGGIRYIWIDLSTYKETSDIDIVQLKSGEGFDDSIKVDSITEKTTGHGVNIEESNITDDDLTVAELHTDNISGNGDTVQIDATILIDKITDNTGDGVDIQSVILKNGLVTLDEINTASITKLTDTNPLPITDVVLYDSLNVGSETIFFTKFTPYPRIPSSTSYTIPGGSVDYITYIIYIEAYGLFLALGSSTIANSQAMMYESSNGNEWRQILAFGSWAPTALIYNPHSGVIVIVRDEFVTYSLGRDEQGEYFGGVNPSLYYAKLSGSNHWGTGADICDICYNSNNHDIVAVGASGKIYLSEDGGLTFELKVEHADGIDLKSIAYCSDTNRYIIGGNTGHIYLMDSDYIITDYDYSTSTWGTAYAHNGKFLLGGDGEILIVDPTPLFAKHILGLQGHISDIIYIEDRYVITTRNGVYYISDLDNPNPTLLTGIHTKGINTIACNDNIIMIGGAKYNTTTPKFTYTSNILRII